MSEREPYRRRIVDDELSELISELAAVALEGPKGVGKTRTALQYARTVRRLDDPAQLAVAQAAPERLLDGEPPVLLDEWQRLPSVWDLVRRRVDDGAPAGSFLLTGSAIPDPPPTHSGAGRIVGVRMRPFSLAERLGSHSVSLGELLAGGREAVTGTTERTVEEYAAEVLASGFPGIRGLSGRARRQQLDGYIERVVDRDIPDDAGVTIRNPAALRRWMVAYAAASSSTASFEKIRDAASGGEDRKPSKETVQNYRDALTRVWVLDEVPAWLPSGSTLRELAQAPKHQLADPALAAGLLGASLETLLVGRGRLIPGAPPDRTLLGALFESLVTLSLRIYAQQNEARVGHFRTARGRHEADLIVEARDGGVVAFEVKLTRTATDTHVHHLAWLGEQVGERLRDAVVITTGPIAYRRPDGVAVVPAALLGP
ncbi:MAG: ATP-binding protein [Solirubrobacterales bacterium]|nr:ATP-binding protein [Solirubrobacterales bacterium]